MSWYYSYYQTSGEEIAEKDIKVESIRINDFLDIVRSYSSSRNICCVISVGDSWIFE